MQKLESQQTKNFYHWPYLNYNILLCSLTVESDSIIPFRIECLFFVIGLNGSTFILYHTIWISRWNKKLIPDLVSVRLLGILRDSRKWKHFVLLFLWLSDRKTDLWLSICFHVHQAPSAKRFTLMENLCETKIFQPITEATTSLSELPPM